MSKHLVSCHHWVDFCLHPNTDNFKDIPFFKMRWVPESHRARVYKLFMDTYPSFVKKSPPERNGKKEKIRKRKEAGEEKKGSEGKLTSMAEWELDAHVSPQWLVTVWTGFRSTHEQEDVHTALHRRRQRSANQRRRRTTIHSQVPIAFRILVITSL